MKSRDNVIYYNFKSLYNNVSHAILILSRYIVCTCAQYADIPVQTQTHVHADVWF